MHDLIVVTLAVPGSTATRAALLAASLREFGGRLVGAPVRLMVPKHRQGFGLRERQAVADVGVTIVPFSIDRDAEAFPFAAKVAAAAAAEERFAATTHRLAWLDVDTLILGEPAGLVIPGGVALGYRPVHHRLIGPRPGHPPGPFWDLVYRTCGVNPGAVFPMTTHVGRQIGAYFNAGTFVVRPERGLLNTWWATFHDACRSPEFVAWCEKDDLYAIFAHQAIWTGVLLAALDRAEMQELGADFNYPLHLHHEIPVALRPDRIDDLTTVRYEDLLSGPGWRNLPFGDDLRAWLEQRLAGA